jgi:hypothetical protein
VEVIPVSQTQDRFSTARLIIPEDPERYSGGAKDFHQRAGDPLSPAIVRRRATDVEKDLVELGIIGRQIETLSPA